MTANIEIDITLHDPDWPDVQNIIERAIKHTMTHLPASETPTEVSVVLADDAFIQELNKTYRGMDKPTNVLSFPQDEDFHLGDIVFARETIEREATEQSKDFENHLIHLTVHGFLHLLGYDHETEDEATEMESFEIQILDELGIENPYL